MMDRSRFLQVMAIPECRSSALGQHVWGTSRTLGRVCIHCFTSETNMGKQDRGFASMDQAKQRKIASKGGKAAHAKGAAHEWTVEEARVAGSKGGTALHTKRRAAKASSAPASQ